MELLHQDEDCAKAPPSELNHPFHRNHSLILQTYAQGQYVCNFCDKDCRNFFYHCSSSCHLYLHIKCALFLCNIAEKGIGDHLQHIVYIDPISIHSTDQMRCFVCWNPLSDSTYLSPDCGFRIHKKCAELALETKRSFHFGKPLFLQFNPKLLHCHACKEVQSRGLVYCDDQICLHIECPIHPKLVFSLLNYAYLSLGFGLLKKYLPLEIKHSFHLQHPLILQLNARLLRCRVCQEITKPWGFVYCCSPCNFVVHIKCPKVPAEIIRHPCHPKHPFLLRQVNEDERLLCQCCLETDPNKLVYCCPTCDLKIAFHVGCIAPPPVIEDDKGHEHSFTLCWRQFPFVCNACGRRGNYVSYVCLMCGFIVHKNCTSLPPFFDLPRHDHRLHHTYFLEAEDEHFKARNCRICNSKVDTRYGSYSCPSSNCNYFCHVNCAIKDYNWYSFDEPKALTTDIDDQSFDSSTISFTKVGADQIISHSSHQHNLVLSEDNVDDGKLCDGCISLIISAPYYHCSNCDFFLHKSCVELPKKKKLWFHRHQIPLTLISDSVFTCGVCEFECSGFAYKCSHRSCRNTCLRCASTNPDTSQGHDHKLSFYEGKEAECSACGEKSMVEYWCNDCNGDFAVHDKCLKLPQIVEHKCDGHLLKLITHRDDNNYVHHNHCDICEETRNPNHWFYHCGICDTSAHPKCVIGKYPFIKRGSRYSKGDHRHRPLIFVQKDYDHPQCHECDKHCLDLALECAEKGCDYIVHWECIKPSPEYIEWKPIEIVEDPEITSLFGWLLFNYFWRWAPSLRSILIVIFFTLLFHLILVILGASVF